MSLIMIYKKTNNLTLLITLVLLSSCGSAKFIVTKDKCTIKKHWKEHLYQVRINKKKINKHWYLEDDARSVMEQLASENKCMKQ